MENFNNLNNYRSIFVKFLGPTNHRGDRIVLKDKDRNESITFSFDYSIGNVQQQAFRILKKGNFNIIGKSYIQGYYLFLCDNWGENFVRLKDLKNIKL